MAVFKDRVFGVADGLVYLFFRCRWEKGTALPLFEGCDFHDCDLGGNAVSTLYNCRLYQTNLDGCDFSRADVRWSETHPGSPSSAVGCNWPGIAAVNDCRWWAGLRFGPGEVYALLTLALLPESPDRKAIFASVPRKHMDRVRALLKRPFGGKR
jgi:hypothetical protein